MDIYSAVILILPEVAAQLRDVLHAQIGNEREILLLQLGHGT